MRKWGFNAVGILACTAFMTVAMGQNVRAAGDVPDNVDEVQSGQSYDNNNHDLRSNAGTITTNNADIVTNTGRVTNNNGVVGSNENNGNISNNGSSTNNTARVVYNHAFVGQNYGTVNVNEDAVYINKSGGTVITNESNGEVTDNYGTVTTNKSGGTVISNWGTVTTNESGGIVRNAADSASSTAGAVGTNRGTVHTADGKSSYVQNNHGTVIGASSGGGTVTIVNNFGGEVTKNSSSVTITNNYGENTINGTGVTITNQYYSVAFSNANSSVEYSFGFTDANNQKWIKTQGTGSGPGIITVTPDSGYEISGDEVTNANGTSGTKTFTYSVQKQNGTAVISILSPSGNITVSASTFNLMIQAI